MAKICHICPLLMKLKSFETKKHHEGLSTFYRLSSPFKDVFKSRITSKIVAQHPGIVNKYSLKVAPLIFRSTAAKNTTNERYPEA